MAFTKITNADLAERGATTLPNQPNMSATALKQEFDAPAKEIVAPKFNNLIDELEATTAAASLGATAPEGRSGDTVQEVIDDISEDLATLEESVIPPLVEDTHTHENKALLDTYEQTEADLASAVTNTHTHSNKAVIDKFGESGGNVTYDDTQLATPEYVSGAISGKADKVLGATNGNFAGLDSNGNLTDSGKKTSDFQAKLTLPLAVEKGGTGSSSGYIQTGAAMWSVNAYNATIEGQGNHAAGLASHAEGREVSAPGDGSHAEGYYAFSSGEGSHAEGYYTEAKGKYSHAEGNSTTAGYDYQHVSGMYNRNKSTTLFEVGNGSNGATSNAFEVYSDGTLSTDNGTTKVKLENLVEKYIEQSTYTDSGIYRTFTFTDARITTTGRYEYYCNVINKNPSDVTISSGSMSVKFAISDGVTVCGVTIK